MRLGRRWKWAIATVLTATLVLGASSFLPDPSWNWIEKHGGKQVAISDPSLAQDTEMSFRGKNARAETREYVFENSTDELLRDLEANSTSFWDTHIQGRERWYVLYLERPELAKPKRIQVTRMVPFSWLEARIHGMKQNLGLEK